VVRETVVEVGPSEANARQWIQLLDMLAEQLHDDTSPVAREHWQHRKVLAALHRAAGALDVAHPGGLDRVGH
jgi:hypothetical protein